MNYEDMTHVELLEEIRQKTSENIELEDRCGQKDVEILHLQREVERLTVLENEFKTRILENLRSLPLETLRNINEEYARKKA